MGLEISGGRDLGADHDEITNKQKAKHIIGLVKPNAIHNKIQLNKNRPKGQNATQQHRW